MILHHFNFMVAAVVETSKVLSALYSFLLLILHFQLFPIFPQGVQFSSSTVIRKYFQIGKKTDFSAFHSSTWGNAHTTHSLLFSFGNINLQFHEEHYVYYAPPFTKFLIIFTELDTIAIQALVKKALL